MEKMISAGKFLVW